MVHRENTIWYFRWSRQPVTGKDNKSGEGKDIKNDPICGSQYGNPTVHGASASPS